MPNEILSKRSASAALTITLASLANGSSRQATQITDASPSAPIVEVFYRVTTGTSPAASGLVEFYLSKADDDATEHADGSTGTADAAFSGDLNELLPVHAQLVTSVSDIAYRGSFFLQEPGTDWRLVVKNATGAALHATGGNHWIRYRSIIPEVQ